VVIMMPLNIRAMTIEVYHLLGIALIFSGIMMTTFRVRPSSRL